jgi:hypothetical protein
VRLPERGHQRSRGYPNYHLSPSGGKEVVRHYLLQMMTTFKMVLTSFKKDGSNTYTVSLKTGDTSATASSWRRGNGAADCKHIRALRALIARGEL